MKIILLFVVVATWYLVPGSSKATAKMKLFFLCVLSFISKSIVTVVVPL